MSDYKKLPLIFLIVWSLCSTSSTLAQFAEPVPQWIWWPDHTAGRVPVGSCYFRKFFELERAESASIAIAADDFFELYVNGRHIGDGTNKKGIVTFDVTDHINHGANLIAIHVSNNAGSTAGLAVRLAVRGENQPEKIFVSDATWRTSLGILPLWNHAGYLDRRWKPAKSIGMFSDFVVRQQRAQARVGKPQVAETVDPAADAKPRPSNSTQQAKTLTRLPSAGRNLDVPREFHLQQIAGHQDVGSLTAMTFNEFGHIVAAREDGALLLLHNENGSGRFTTVREYCHLLKSCQGMLAMNGHLFAVGIGPDGSGLYRLSDTQGDGLLDKAALIVKLEGTNVEHGPHGIVLGSDGLIYVVVGNHSSLPNGFSKSSPYRHPYEGDLVRPKIEDPGGHASGVESPGGFVFRTDPNGSRVEIVAGGIRNAYDLAIDAQGEIFTHDSDMEADEGTPWFRPTRVYHVTPGAEFGWRSGWSKWPDYFIDSTPAVADTGRGSPTGMVFYDHRMFPEEYRHVLFSCDWSEGRILAIRMQEDGASYRASPEVFIRGEPLNVTDIEVGPGGGLYFSTGGRGTSGNIYRVTWRGRSARTPRDSGSHIDRALQQPQLNSSWARQQVAKLRHTVGKDWVPQLSAAAVDASRPAEDRVQAIRIMQWMDDGPGLDLLLELAADKDAVVRRQAAYSLGLLTDAAASQRLIELLHDDDALVRRRACESLARSGRIPSFHQLTHLFDTTDRMQAWAARRLLEQIPREEWEDLVLSTREISLFLHGATAILVSQPDAHVARAIIDRTMEWMDGFINDTNFISILRVQQLALLRGNLPPDSLPVFTEKIAEEYPSSSHSINRELVRLVTYLQATSAMDRYLAELQSDLPTAERAHLAIHLTRLRSGWTTERKLALVRHLDAVSEPGSGLQSYLESVSAEFGKTLSSTEIAKILKNGHLWPRIAQAVLIQLPERLSAEQFEQVRALDGQLEGKDSDAHKRLKVAIVAVLARDQSPPSFSYLRQCYDRDPSRRVEIAVGLAEQPTGENWDVLVRSLPLLDRTAAKHVLSQLKKVSKTPRDAEPYHQVIVASQQLGNDGAQDAVALLERWQGFAPSSADLPWEPKVNAWKAWYAKTFPEAPAPEPTVLSQDGQWDYDSLLRHLTEAERTGAGSIHRGKQVFVKAECAKCHRFADQGESMGPDLTGVSRRFLTREILESIVYPSKVISDQYSAKIVTTVSGQSYVGIVARDVAGEMSVLQSNGEKVRIPETEVDDIEPSQLSAMPEGTLNQLTLEEITDLFAYLSSSSQRVSRTRSGDDRR